MNQQSASRRLIRFGTFETDLATRELRKNGVKLRLQDQPFQVLSVLLENPGTVVTREGLRQRLWPADTFVDFDNGLNTAINKIREALGDSAESPRFVETIPRRGYRFIAPVQALPAQETDLLSVRLGRKQGDSLGALPFGLIAAGIAVALLVLVAVALTYVLTQSHQTALTAPALIRFQIPVPEKIGLLGPFALSPDGQQLAFVETGSDGVHRLWVRTMNSLEAHPLPGSESTVDVAFFWSPDSRFVAFPSGGELKKIDISGGSAQTLCDLRAGIEGGSWSRDGVIIFASDESGTLMRVSANGGTASPLTALDTSRGETAHHFPSFLPDGRHFVYLRYSPTPAKSGIYVGSLDAKPEEQDSRQLLATEYGALYAPSRDPVYGQLLFLRDGTLFAQPFDARRLKLAGEPVTVAERVETYAAYGFFSASTNDVLIYWPRPGSGAFGFFQLTWYDRQGKAEGKVGEPGFQFYVALSPDGTRAAVQSIEPGRPATHIFLFDLLRGTTARFSFGSYSDWCPVWSPDGNRIIFASDRVGKSALYVKPVNGDKVEELLLKSDEQLAPTSWSRDGRFVLYHTIDPKNSDLWVLPLEGDKRPIPFLRTEFDEWNGRFSPDGHWVAYVSNKSGRYEIYVRAFSFDSTEAAAGAGREWLISTGGGGEPRWRADGKELYYVAPDGELMAVKVTTGQEFRAGIPKLLFSTPLPSNDNAPAGIVMDAAGDGKRFLFRVHGDPAQPPFTVVQNWQTGLKR